jgi:hypothetical protein
MVKHEDKHFQLSPGVSSWCCWPESLGNDHLSNIRVHVLGTFWVETRAAESREILQTEDLGEHTSQVLPVHVH